MLVWLDLQKQPGKHFSTQGVEQVVPYSFNHRFNIETDLDENAIKFFFNGVHTSIDQINAVRKHLDNVLVSFPGVDILNTPLDQLIEENNNKLPHWLHVWIWVYLPIDPLMVQEEDESFCSNQSYNFNKMEVPQDLINQSRQIFAYDVAQVHLENLDEKQLTLLKHRMLKRNPFIHFRREHYSRAPVLPFVITSIEPVQ
jgi:hypothetical protein